MAASGSTTVVVAALVGNGCIAIAKLSAAAWTGSAAMLSEAIHSIADTANQALLLLGIKRSTRSPDARHPFGYAKELYFWAFVVAVLLFSLGSGVALYEGIDKLLHPHPLSDPTVNYIVLGLAMVFEAGATVLAVREFNRRRGTEGVLSALRGSKDPALFTVLLEDAAALIGLAVAMAGIAAAHLLGWQQGDAVASIVIGLILGAVAAFMAIETKALLIGEAATSDTVAGIGRIIQAEMGKDGPVAGINEFRTMHLGPDEVLVAASLNFHDGGSARDVEAAIGRLDMAIKAQYPIVRHLFLEVQSAAGAHGKRPSIPGALQSPPAVAAQPEQAGARSADIRASADGPRKSYPPAKAKAKGRRKRR